MIADVQLAALALSLKLSEIEAKVVEFEVAADAEVVFDPSLKNDQQRKVTRNDYLKSISEYGEAIAAAEKLKIELKRNAIQLDLLRNQFDVAKLLFRREIAVGVPLNSPVAED